MEVQSVSQDDSVTGSNAVPSSGLKSKSESILTPGSQSTSANALFANSTTMPDMLESTPGLVKRTRRRNNRNLRGLNAWERFCVIAAMVLAAILLFQGCASSPVVSNGHCQEPDWYSIGLQDAGRDLAVRQKVQVMCADSDESLSEAIYNNGFDSGIANRCTYRNGWVTGRGGSEQKLSCPLITQDEFDRGLMDGLRVYRLREHEVSVLNQIQDLQVLLDKSAENAKSTKDLKIQKQRLESTRSGIVSQIESLERQRQ
jgi:hypothetical protein